VSASEKEGCMVKFDETLYVKSDNRNVMIGGKSDEMTATDLEAGVARIGGFWRHPNYFEAYLHAASLLIAQGKTTGTLDEIGLPGFYLQRHAVELLLKELLKLLTDISDLRNRLRMSEVQPSKTLVKHLGNCHTLDILHEHLMQFSLELDLSQPPIELGDLVRDMKKFEVTDTWARYSLSTKRDPHIPKEVLVPIVEFQDRLAAIASRISSRDLGGDTYEDELIAIYLSLDAALNHQ